MELNFSRAEVPITEPTKLAAQVKRVMGEFPNIGIPTEIRRIGDTITKGDGIIHTLIALIFMTGVIITIIIIVSLVLQVYLKIMGEEEKR